MFGFSAFSVTPLSALKRDATEITIEGYTVLNQATTQAQGWEWNGTEWVSALETVHIGDDWDGTNITKPKPTYTPEV